MNHFLDVSPAALGAVPGDVFDHVPFQKSQSVGMNVCNGLDLAVFVMVSSNLPVERVGHRRPRTRRRMSDIRVMNFSLALSDVQQFTKYGSLATSACSCGSST